MALVIGQAIYGERNRGHRLLGASPSFPEADRLEGRMDMQGTPPPHLAWDPYLSGFPWADFYVLARTMPDPGAARPGMVFSRALAIPVAEAGQLKDIGGLLELLTELGDTRSPIDDLRWRPAVRPPSPNTGLVQALLKAGQDPVVWPGETGFAEALAALWSRLWPAARLALRFRVAFSPSDVKSDPPILVTTPTTLISRWSEYRVVRPDSEPSADDVAERFLLGEDKIGDLDALIETLGPQITSVGEIRRLVGMGALLTNPGAFEDYLDALRLACHLAPEPTQGETLKAQLIERAVTAMKQASAAQIRMARNLDLVPASSGADFWKGLSTWAKSILWTDPDTEMLGQVLEDGYSTKGVPAWRTAVVEGTTGAIARPTTNVARALWQVLAPRPTLLALLAQRGDGLARKLEAVLVANTPARLGTAPAEIIASAALSQGMISLHAACCAASLPPVEAIRLHIAKAPFHAESLAIAAKNAKGRDLVAVAIEEEDHETLALAAKAAADAPTLLKKLDVGDRRWRALWTEALRFDLGAAAGPADPPRVMATLLDGLIDGSGNDTSLVEALGATPLADISHYESRSEIWSKLSPGVREQYLNATADGWLTAIESGEDLVCDPDLAQKVMLPERLDPALRRLAALPARGCRLFRALPLLSEALFIRWLDTVLLQHRRLDSEDVLAIGRLVASRSWRSAARGLADAVLDDQRHELRPAIDYLTDLIGLIQQYRLDAWGSTAPKSARWRILEEVTVELYGHGPGDGRVWQRAGGKDSDIPKGKTGADMWRKAISEAEKGKGDIDITRLIKVMAEDYPHHRALQKMRWDSAFERRQ